MGIKSYFTIGAIAVGAVLLLSIVLGSFYTVDESERGVITRNGAVTGIAEPGFHYKFPFIDDVAMFDIGEHVTPLQLETYSFDQQVATINLSVNWSVEPTLAREAYSAGFRIVDDFDTRIVQRRVPDATKAVFGQYTASRAIQERSVLNQAISEAIIAELEGTFINIINIQIEDIAFSAEYETAVEARMTAEVEVGRIQQQAEQERITAEITVIRAEAEANAQLAAARAEAEATRIQGEAEADAIRARGEALRDNPDLVGLVAAERWNGELPTQMVPQGALPFIDLTPVTE